MPTDAMLSISYRHDNKNQRLIREYVPGGLLLIWYYSAGWENCQVGIKETFLFCMTVFGLYSQMPG